MSPASPVSAVVVTWNAAGTISRCLQSLDTQTEPPREIILVDNASTDGTLERVAATPLATPLVILENRANLGFCAATNQGIAASRGDYVLALNPDAYLTDSYLAILVAVLESSPAKRAGAATGKVYRWIEMSPSPPLEPSNPALLDTTGMFMTPQGRHLDRGAGEPDAGRYPRREWVFGVSAAAALYRRAMLDDLGLDGEVFDTDFFAYREDADLAWRGQQRGWGALYIPEAVAFHRRGVTPERRATISAAINCHSVKNRFLLRWKNQTLAHALRFAAPLLLRDLAVAGYVLLRERTSLPAFVYLWKHRKRLAAKRRAVQARRTVGAAALNHWFRTYPVSYPFDPSQSARTPRG